MSNYLHAPTVGAIQYNARYWRPDNSEEDTSEINHTIATDSEIAYRGEGETG